MVLASMEVVTVNRLRCALFLVISLALVCVGQEAMDFGSVPVGTIISATYTLRNTNPFNCTLEAIGFGEDYSPASDVFAISNLELPIPIDVGDWHELGFTYDGTGVGDGVVTLYLDGQAIGAMVPGAFDTDDVFHIGNGPGSRWDFHGLFDRVQFWGEAVDADTMAALSVPEPSSLMLVLLGLSGLAMVRRRR